MHNCLFDLPLLFRRAYGVVDACRDRWRTRRTQEIWRKQNRLKYDKQGVVFQSPSFKSRSVYQNKYVDEIA
jgi:hypothetical protein